MDFFKGADGNKLVKWAGWAVILLTIFLAVQTLAAFKAWREPNPVFNSISVTGEGEVVAIPDVAVFSFTVSADASDVNAAQESVTEKMDAVLAALKDLGIEDKDIKTTDYSVWPRYSYTSASSPAIYPPIPGRQVLDGYTANHSVTVKVRETDKAGEALGLAGANGATNISGITFTNDDPEAAIQEARALAIKDAREKAAQLSKNLGVRLVRIISYYDNSMNPPMPYGMGGDVSFKAVESLQSTPTIPQGENKVKMNVTVTYEIR